MRLSQYEVTVGQLRYWMSWNQWTGGRVSVRPGIHNKCPSVGDSRYKLVAHAGLSNVNVLFALCLPLCNLLKTEQQLI